jgi:hypothetical protein
MAHMSADFILSARHCIPIAALCAPPARAFNGCPDARTRQQASLRTDRGAMLPLQPGGLKNHVSKFSGFPSPTATRQAGEARQARASERAAELAPIVKDIQAAGVTSLRGIARALNERGISPPRGHGWQATQVRRLLARLAG